jgi:hypothetical protein
MCSSIRSVCMGSMDGVRSGRRAGACGVSGVAGSGVLQLQPNVSSEMWRVAFPSSNQVRRWTNSVRRREERGARAGAERHGELDFSTERRTRGVPRHRVESRRVLDGSSNFQKAHGLNPSDASDGNKTNLSKVGYTNLEMYLNELAGDYE